MNQLIALALDTDGGGLNGLTIVNAFPAAQLTLPTADIQQVVVTFQSGSVEDLIITNAYIGHRAGSGDAYDFATTPVQLLFGGNANVTIPVSSTQASDAAAFVYDKTSDLLIAMYINGGTTHDTCKTKTGMAASLVSYFKLANEAATVNKSAGYTANTGQIRAVSKIEAVIPSNSFFMFF